MLNSYQRGESESIERRVRELLELNARTLDELRHLIADLRPSHLDDLGLPATLRWYAKEVQQRALFEIQVEIDGVERPLDSAVSTALFRIAQEALTNIIKYAQASYAWIRLSYSDCEVELQVEDNGQGFNPSFPAQANRSAWGVLGMRERAELLGGQFELQSSVGHGTHVQVTIPYQVIDNHPERNEVESKDTVHT
jgi:signal transduction histidine kinase